MPTVKTETNVEVLVVKATELLSLQSIQGQPNKTTALGYYNNKILNVVGTLDLILQIESQFTAYAVYAKPSNVTGCSAEYKDGIGWVGCLGSFATTSDFQAAVPSTSNVGFDRAWALIAGLAQVVSTGFVLKNSSIQDARYSQKVNPTVKQRSIGFNAYDLLAAKLDGNSTGDNSAVLDYAVSCGAKIVRVMYPVYDATKWTTQVFQGSIPGRDFIESDFQQSFLSASDVLFQEFTARGLLMHACLFWHRANTATACGETEATAFTSTTTMTAIFMQRFTRWFVGRYSMSSAFGVISFGNEWNPTELDSGSVVTAAQLGSVFKSVSDAAKSVDKNVITTANQIAIPIESTAVRVTLDQGIGLFTTIFAGLDAWCLHIYAVSGYVGRNAAYSGVATGVLASNNYGYEYSRALVASLSDAARSRGKLFVVGETGMNNVQVSDTDLVKRRRFLQALSEYSDYTLVWNLQPTARAALSSGQLPICIEPGTSRASSWQSVVTSLNGSCLRNPTLRGIGNSSLLDRYSPSKCFTSSRVTNGHVSIPSPVAVGSGGYAVAMWMRFNATQQNADQYVHFRDAGDNTGFVAISTSTVGSLYGSFKSAGTLLGNSSGLLPNIAVGSWFHIAWSYVPGTPFVIDLFLNGMFWGTFLLTADSVDIAAGSSFVAAASAVAGTGCPVSFQDVTVWQRAIGIEDVMQHAQGDVSPEAAIHLRATATQIIDVSRFGGTVTKGSAVTLETLR